MNITGVNGQLGNRIKKRRKAKDVDKMLNSLFTKKSEHIKSVLRQFTKTTYDALKYSIKGSGVLISIV